MGSYTSGYKEIYYLKSITTKTHKAEFILSTDHRLDALDAAHDNDVAANSKSAQGTNELKYLTEVALYALGQDGESDQLIQRTYFKYDYSLCNHTPNSKDTGKLTLKKLWTEYADVHPYKVSSYEFTYGYPADGTYPSKYADLDNYGNYTPEQQNPDYDEYSVDAWGYYQNSGEDQFKKYSSSIKQKEDSTFDPAAYHLKKIELPSGGEIHIQYEQDDYAYVQDRPAMVMVPIKKIEAASAGIEGDANDYYFLDLGAVGVDVTNESLLEAIRDEIEKAFTGTAADRIYFKFLYDLTGTGDELCHPEYFEGYASVEDVKVEDNSVTIKFNKGSGDIVPRTICKEYYNTHWLSGLGINNCTFENIDLDGDATEVIYNLLDAVTELGVYLDVNALGNCVSIDDTLSYLRVPIGNSKKGGGVRVKRLLTWDDGLEANDAVLYGQEYMYKDENSISTGVALNEPGTLGGENALVSFLDRSDDYNFIEKRLRGGDKDLQQYKGPIGEGILPGESVGYSKVITKNIHSGKTNPGFSQTEFYTAKDFPFDGYLPSVSASAVDFTDISEEKDLYFFTVVLSSQMISSIWASQGYRFILNDMHGKLKQASTYQGDYDNILDVTQRALSTQQTYTYSEPGEALTVMDNWGKYEDVQLGKEMEVIFDSRTISDLTLDGSLEVDANVLLVPPIVVAAPTFQLYTKFNYSQLSTHITNKIIKYPSVLKSVTSFKDGVYSTIDNLVFDKYTGDPIIRKSFDSYDTLDLQRDTDHAGYYFNYQVPSTYYYDAMGPKYKTDRMVFTSNGSLNITKIKDPSGSYYLEFDGDDACTAASFFTPGDWLALSDCNGVEVYYADTLVQNKLIIEPHPNFAYSKDTCKSLTVEIIRTARSNQLSVPSTNVVTYGASLDDYTVEYDPGLTARVEIANLLNKLLATFKAKGTEQKTTLTIPDGLEYDGTCREGSNIIEVSLSPVSGSSDKVLFCVPHETITSNKVTDGGSATTLKSGMSLRNPQLTFLKSAPGNSRVGGYRNQEINKSDDKKYDPLGSGGIPICQCEFGFSTQVTGLTDVTPKKYWLPSDTIKSFSPSGFEFRFTVEGGDGATKYVQAMDTDCLSPYSSMALFIRDCQLTLFDQNYYDREVNRVCFYYCDDHAEMDSIHIESEVVTFDTSGNVIADFTRTPSPYITVTEDYTTPAVSHGRVEISLNHGDNFKTIRIFSKSLIIDTIQFCVSDSVEQEPDTIEAMCYDTLGVNGYFAVDSLNGELVYYADGWCAPEILNCLNLCQAIYPERKLKNVITASENIFRSDWTHEDELLDKYYTLDPAESDYHHALKGIWRPWFNANYREDIEGIYDEATDRVYNAGYFKELDLFNHDYLEANLNTGWIPQNEAMLVSQNGNVVESENALDIPFSSQYGEPANLPVFTAKNADYDEVSFSSFDCGLDYASGPATKSMNDVTAISGLVSKLDARTNQSAHSGIYSLKFTFTKGEDYLELRPFTLTSRDKDEGVLISLWVKTASDKDAHLTFQDGDGHIPNAAFEKIAKTGEWTLFEITLKDFGSLPIGSEFKPRIHLTVPEDLLISQTYYVDDIRVQPVAAQVSCYVYDSKQRLIVSFDDDHFGTYYRYDLEGRLNKKVLETERGMEEVQENYYNTWKRDK